MVSYVFKELLGIDQRASFVENTGRGVGEGLNMSSNMGPSEVKMVVYEGSRK